MQSGMRLCLMVLVVGVMEGSSYTSFTSFGSRFPFGNRFSSTYQPYSSYSAYPGHAQPYSGFPIYPGVAAGVALPLSCPVCDSSVYSYCSHKLFHDACCCTDGYYGDNSLECGYSDCSFLHANSCRESELISNCCCEDYKAYSAPYFNRFFNKK